MIITSGRQRSIFAKKNFFQKTYPIGKLLEVLAFTWGDPSPLTSNITQHLLQATCELIPVASQWQVLVVPEDWLCRKLEGVNLTIPNTQAAPPKLVASNGS